MDRLNQADPEKSLLRRDAAMQNEGRVNLLRRLRVNLFFPQTAVFPPTRVDFASY